MSHLVSTLISEGSSDRALLPVLRWLLAASSSRTFQLQWADFRRLSHPPRTLKDKIDAAAVLFRSDLLFVHRDGDGMPHATRVREIRTELAAARAGTAVCVVPVRATETWLLIDENALRMAAGNPRGTAPLSMPSLPTLETLPDPKSRLYDLLRTASGLRPRRPFHPPARIHRLADLIEDFSLLRKLAAFRALESDLFEILAERSWR